MIYVSATCGASAIHAGDIHTYVGDSGLAALLVMVVNPRLWQDYLLCLLHPFDIIHVRSVQYTMHLRRWELHDS